MPTSLPTPCLCLVTDAALAHDELVERVSNAVEGGVDLVQLRYKSLPGGQLLDLTSSVLEAMGGRAKLVVNERADVALAAGAHGVQLGEEGLPVAAARRILGEGLLIGRSVHSTEVAVQAELDGSDFLVVGTMYASRSHIGELPAGPGLMWEISSKCHLPLIGIGGVVPENTAELIEAGASGVAVITNILAAEDPRTAAERLKEILVASWNTRMNPPDVGTGDG